MARLYRQAPDGDDVSARRTILDALLLHRWRWSEGREPQDAEREPILEGSTAGAVRVPASESDPPDDHSAIFARELLANLYRASDPQFRATVIRSISKIDRGIFIQSLQEIIDIAREHRATELALALELTKILDDRESAERLQEQLSSIIAGRGEKCAPSYRAGHPTMIERSVY